MRSRGWCRDMGHVVSIVREAEDHDAKRIGATYRKGNEAYKEVGTALIAKRAVIAGSAMRSNAWGDWLKKNEDALGFGPTTARRLMKFAGARASKVNWSSGKPGKANSPPDHSRDDDSDLGSEFKSEDERYQFLFDGKIHDADAAADACLDYLPKARNPRVASIKKVIQAWEKVLRRASNE